MQEMAVKQNSVSLSLSWGESRGGDRCSDLFHLLSSLPIDLSGVPLVSHDEIVEVEKPSSMPTLPPDRLWDRDLPACLTIVLKVIESCLPLNEEEDH
jgi:hypothetical protein